jgi:site-specific DNA recombinase
LNCAVYIRVSTDKEEQKASLENQQRFFYNIISERGWDLYNFYVDIESGTNDKKRKNLKRLIEDAKERKFDVILSKELSRLARNGKLSYEIKDIAENNNVHIITFDNAINSMDGNIHMFGLYAWIYEQESQRTSERIKAALFTNAKRGNFKGSNPPYGYKVVNKKLIPSGDVTTENVKRIYSMYLAGMGFDAIARNLSKELQPTPAQVAKKKNAGQYWLGSTIRNILTNPHYTGDLVQGRETTRSVTSSKREKVPLEKQVVIKNAHPSIISYNDFETVQQLIQSRKCNITKPNKHLFTNLIYCKDCGTGMWYRHNREGYICGKYARHGAIACTHRTINEQSLKSKILADISKMETLINQPNFLDEVTKKSKKNINNAKKSIDNINQEISKLKMKKKRYMELLVEDILTHEEYRDTANTLQEEIILLKGKRSEHKATLQENNLPKKISYLRDLINLYSPLNDVTKEMLSYFVNRIEVDKNGVPKIHYRFSFLND